MSEKTSRLSGENVTLRGVAHRVYWAYPMTVVQDSSDLIVLYMPAGVPGKNVEHKPTLEELLAPEKINVVDHRWERTDVLMLIVPKDSFSTYVMWETGTKNLICWYVNLQEPIRRTAIGFDTMDNMLDIIISPDMSEWRWKDDDEFTAAQNAGIYSAQKAREVWNAGAQAVRLITQERRLLYEPWSQWRANPEWKMPELSLRWQEMNL